MDFIDEAQNYINSHTIELEPINLQNPSKHEGIQLYKDLLNRYHAVEKYKKEAEI